LTLAPLRIHIPQRQRPPSIPVPAKLQLGKSSPAKLCRAQVWEHVRASCSNIAGKFCGIKPKAVGS